MKKRALYIIIPVLAVAIIAIYFAFDPMAVSFMPRCIFHELTGWQCPGCGSQRMLHALLHGDIAGAWHHNALLLCLLPLLIPFGWLEINRKRHPKVYMRAHSVPAVLTVTVVILGWWILRNIL